MEETAYRGNSVIRKLAEVLIEMENATSPGTEEDFKPQKANAERTNVESRYWQRMDLESTPEHWEAGSK